MIANLMFYYLDSTTHINYFIKESHECRSASATLRKDIISTRQNRFLLSVNQAKQPVRAQDEVYRIY